MLDLLTSIENRQKRIARWLPEIPKRTADSSAVAHHAPQTDIELAAHVRDTFGATLPDHQVCENHTTPFRAFADAFFARSTVAVWKASRGFGGKTFMLALLGLTESLALKCDVNVLGGSGEQSTNVIKYMDDWFVRPDVGKHLTNDAQTIKRLSAGNEIRALLASSRSARGPHVPRLRLDEVDEMDVTILDAAMGQPMMQGGVAKQTVMSSTHQYADGTMTEIINRAAVRGWPIYEWCWKETLEPHGWLSPAEVESKRNEVTEAMWASEYDLQEPSPESRAIAPSKVAAMFQRDLGVFDGAPHEYIEIEEPQAGGLYATGADWARKQDWTIISTFRLDVRPIRLVAFERMGREPWPVMIGRFDERVNRFGGSSAHDGTGIGDVVAGMMKTHQAQSIIMAGRARKDMLSNYIGAIEHSEIEAPFIKWMEKEHRLASVDDVYGEGHCPDTIAASAIAWVVAQVIPILAASAPVVGRPVHASRPRSSWNRGA